MINFESLKLVNGNKYTVCFYDGLTGFVNFQIKLTDYMTIAAFQFEPAIILRFKNRNGRREYEQIFSTKDSFVILEGWVKPNFDELFKIRESASCVRRQSMYSPWSSKYMEIVEQQFSDSITYKHVGTLPLAK